MEVDVVPPRDLVSEIVVVPRLLELLDTPEVHGLVLQLGQLGLDCLEELHDAK